MDTLATRGEGTEGQEAGAEERHHRAAFRDILVQVEVTARDTALRQRKIKPDREGNRIARANGTAK